MRRNLLRARHGIAYLTGGSEPPLGTSPKSTVWRRDKARLYRFSSDVRRYAPPVLIVHSLVSRSYILDLTPQMSFAGSLRDAGFDVYLLDWGEPDSTDAANTLEKYIDGYVRESVESILEVSGSSDVTLLGYCFGGVLATMFTLRHPRFVRNLITMAMPVDFTELGVLSGVFKQGRLEPDFIIDETGNVPAAMMHTSFKLLRPTGSTVQYANLWQNLWNDEYVEGHKAMTRWTSDHIPFAGAAFRQVIDLFMRDNALMTGTVELGDTSTALSELFCPVLNVFAERDHVVPPEAAEPLAGLVGSSDVEELRIPGGHASLVTGRQAAKVTLPGIIRWLDDHSEEVISA